MTARQNVTPANWFDLPMRWATLTMTHHDPGHFDPQYWLDLVKKTHCDAASWNSGGIVAFYPTQIPFHQRTPLLGDSDPLGYLVDGCRDMGITVTARVDHHATYDEAAQAHPEWIAVDADGQKRRHWAKSDLWVTCALGTYNADFMTRVMQEVMETYRVDGFNHNRWGPQGMCFCAWCRTHFENATGFDLPRTDDPHDKSWRAYQIWRENRIFELWDIWDGAVRKINPNAGILPGIGAEALKLNMSKLRQRAHTMYLDRQGRSGVNPPWMAGRGGKQLHAVLGGKPAGLTFTVGHEVGQYRWKDSVQTDAEIRIWVAEGFAQCLRPKWCKFDGHVYDARWIPVVEKMYAWAEKIEPYLRPVRSLARVAMLYSQQTPRFYEGKSGRGHEQFVRGFYHALVEARIPFDMVHESLLDEAEIDRYKLLILPNCACLSDAQCEQLRGFVARGGSLLATHETSLYDEWGVKRADFGLSDLFGVHCAGETEGPLKNSYLNLERETHSPLFNGFEDEARRAINGSLRVPVEAFEDFGAPPLTLVPPYPDLPMEEVYPRQEHTNIPMFFGRDIGPSRVGYFPFDLDAIFWEVLDFDHARLLKNAVLWATNEAQPASVEGAGIVDMAVWEQANSMTVALVNLTNPMMMKGPMREIMPLSNQQVRLRLPHGKSAARVHLLAADATPQYEIEGEWLSVLVPSIDDLEIVAIDFA